MKECYRYHYESPCMECIQVQAESDFMSGSVMEDPKSEVKISGHEVGGDYDFSKSNGSDFQCKWE